MSESPLSPTAGSGDTLPVQRTSFIGREQDVAAVRSLLVHELTGLVTLTGAGGTGKTRLALEVAAGLRHSFPDGVVFVTLAPIGDPDLVTASIARTLRLPERPGRTPLQAMTDHLRPREVLLLLDNFEHLLAAAAVVAELLASCPRLKVMVTSRSVLRVRGEKEYVVPPLAVPAATQPPNPELLARYPAVALFIDRARDVRPDFVLTAEHAEAVAEICRRLDGLPLAIELAAARSKLLPPRLLLGRLEQRLATLTGGARDLPERQQTLRKAIAWSYALLDLAEQTLFRRLAVFGGGATLAAVEAVTSASDDLAIDVLDGLGSLVDKSLVLLGEVPGQEPRFGMLETIREFGLACLADVGEEQAVRQVHADYFWALARTAAQRSEGPESELWNRRLDPEMDNLRAALRWFDEQGQIDAGLRLAIALSNFWGARNHWTEGYEWLVRLLDRSNSVRDFVRARALMCAGMFNSLQGRSAQQANYVSLAIQLARASGDQRTLVRSLNQLGEAQVYLGRSEEGERLTVEALALAREIGDEMAVFSCLGILGDLALDRGEVDSAVAHFNEALTVLVPWAGTMAGEHLARLALRGLGLAAYLRKHYEVAAARFEELLIRARETNSRDGIALGQAGKGLLALSSRDVATAASAYADAVAIWRELGSERELINCLDGLAVVATFHGEFERAARLFAAGEAAREASSMQQRPVYQPICNSALEVVRSGLSNDFAAHWQAGRVLSLDAAVAVALDQPATAPLPRGMLTPPASTGYPAGLSAREVQVLRLLATGKSNREIAEALFITVNTVLRHVSNIFDKIGVANRHEAAIYAVRQGLGLDSTP